MKWFRISMRNEFHTAGEDGRRHLVQPLPLVIGRAGHQIVPLPRASYLLVAHTVIALRSTTTQHHVLDCEGGQFASPTCPDTLLTVFEPRRLSTVANPHTEAMEKLPDPGKLRQEFILDAFADPTSVRDVVRGESCHSAWVPDIDIHFSLA